MRGRRNYIYMGAFPNMNDREISAHWALALAAWVIGLVLIVVDWRLPRTGLDHFGIYAAMAGATLNVRAWFCRMTERETEAFNLGREYEGTIRSVR